MPKLYAIVLVSLFGVFCAGCSSPPLTGAAAPSSPSGDIATPTAANAVGPEYQDQANGFAILVPAGVERRADFRPDDLDHAGWKAFASGPGARGGRPVLALLLPGSNKITAGELRLGVSARPADVGSCAAPPAEVTGPSDSFNIDGIDFSHFRAGDAAMNHYLQIDAYRAVLHGRCYAIDLLISGTNPEVYEPPATPPFTREQAELRLQSLLQGLRWLR